MSHHDNKKARRWWSAAKPVYDIYISRLVIDECRAGDPSAAQERIDAVDELVRLDVTDKAHDLARALMGGGAIPQTEPRDAVCRGNGYKPPIICTPEELAGMTDEAPEPN